MASLAMAEPDRTENTDSNPAVTATQPILTPQEIYQLLDDERWSKGVIEARRLLATEPSSGLAHLTLGDALSHYPNGDGDIYLAFEAWMTAKTLTPPRSRLNKVTQERLAWALERSGIVKLEPSAFVGTNGFGEGIRVEAFSHLDLDWSPRIEASRGSVYITNIPPGTVVLKITSDLGVYVTSVSLEAGSFETVSVPTESETVESSLESAEWLPYLEAGRQTIDAVVQSTIADARISFDHLVNTMIQLPRAPVPTDSVTTFISQHNERIVYNNGARQTLIGGLYVLEVEKNGKKTYADIVVHSDLSVETIRQLVLNDDLRRSEKESPIVRKTMEDSQVVEPDSVAPQVVVSKSEKSQETPITDVVDTKDTESQTTPSKEPSVAVESTEPTESIESVSAEPEEVPPVESSSVSEAQSEETTPEPDVSEDSVTEESPLVSQTSVEDSKSSFVWSPRSGSQVQRTSLALVGGTALFSGYAMFTADRFARLANAETRSQASFEDYRAKSEQWTSNFGIASVITGHIASLYLGTKLIQWWAVDEISSTPLEQSASDNIDDARALLEGAQ